MTYKEAKDILRVAAAEAEWNCPLDYTEAFQKAEEALDKQIAAPAVSVPQWISVKDRLPEDGEHVLIWYEYFRYGSYNRMYKTYEIAYQYDGFWSGVNPLGQKSRVFAWMPLPEPPKGENDD